MVNFLIAYSLFILFALIVRSLYNFYQFVIYSKEFLWIYNEHLFELLNKLKESDSFESRLFRLKRNNEIIFQFSFSCYEDVVWKIINHVDWLIMKYERALFLNKRDVLLEMRLELENIYSACISRLEWIKKNKKE